MMTILCPKCGMPVEFAGSASARAVCRGCRAVVRRSSAAIEYFDWKSSSFVLKMQFGIVLFLLLGSAAEVGPFRGSILSGATAVLVLFLLLVYFVCICMCASAPDRMARRSVVSCILTLILGTAGLFGGTFLALMSQAAGVPDDWIGWGIGLAAFTVYFSAFAFLMRFHAAVALAFGNRWLARECHLILFAPIVVIAVNVWVERFRLVPPFFDPPAMLELSRTLFNFAVAVWFAMIVLRTFRTIDRGRFAGLRDAEPDDGDFRDPASD